MIQRGIFFLLLLASLLNNPTAFCQTAKEEFKVKFTILDKKVRKDKDDENLLKCVVTINAPLSLQYNFGERLEYTYKGHTGEPCYLEAKDNKGKDYYIKPTGSVDWIYDPIGTPKENLNTITDTISTTIYSLAPGKYKLRWAFKPELSKTTYYSSWEDYEVLPK